MRGLPFAIKAKEITQYDGAIIRAVLLVSSASVFDQNDAVVQSLGEAKLVYS